MMQGNNGCATTGCDFKANTISFSSAQCRQYTPFLLTVAAMLLLE
jgi:hypothetical protein